MGVKQLHSSSYTPLCTGGHGAATHRRSGQQCCAAQRLRKQRHSGLRHIRQRQRQRQQCLHQHSGTAVAAATVAAAVSVVAAAAAAAAAAERQFMRAEHIFEQSVGV